MLVRKFGFVLLFLLAGCFDQVPPSAPPPPPPPASGFPEPVDPFGLDALLGKPFEKLPASVPPVRSGYGSRISPDEKISLRTLDGTWIGYHIGYVKSDRKNEDISRVYFRFNSDNTWDFLCISRAEKPEFYALLSGRSVVEGGLLKLIVGAVKSSEILPDPHLWSRPDLKWVPVTLKCGGNGWHKDFGFIITIKLIDDVMLMFDDQVQFIKPTHRVILLRK